MSEKQIIQIQEQMKEVNRRLDKQDEEFVRLGDKLDNLPMVLKEMFAPKSVENDVRRLDARFWAILLLSLTTSVGIVVTYIL